MEKSEFIWVVVIALIVAVVASFVTVKMTGNVVNVPTSTAVTQTSVYTKAEMDGKINMIYSSVYNLTKASHGLKAPLFELTSTRVKETVYLYANPYEIELVSASDTGATIRVTNKAGGNSSAVAEVPEGTTKKINYVDVQVVSADESNLALSAVLRVSMP